MAATTTLYLDDREKPGEVAPLKIRVYLNRSNIRHYHTKIFLTDDQLQASYFAENPRGKNRELKAEIESVKVKADNIIKSLGVNFSFDKFKRKFYGTSGDSSDAVQHFDIKIAELAENDQVGTASIYRQAIRSLLKFAGNGKEITTLSFYKITPAFLEKYERWFVETEGGKNTSISFYLSYLRTVFNNAIEDGAIPRDIYPFGKGGYTIPSGSNTKKALTPQQLKILYTVPVKPGMQEMARDFFFFSYQANGLNFRDIFELKFKNIEGDRFSFVRQKTKRTTKQKERRIVVPITEPMRDFIGKYSTKQGGPNDYVFPVFKAGMSELDKRKANLKFIKKTIYHMQAIADKAGLNIKVRTMEARHSFTTTVTKKVGLEFASEALGHTNLKTTQNYWAGFDDSTKRELAESLLKFD